MFPIPWNKAYRKKDGTLVNIDDAMGGGGGTSDIPEYSSADAGKALTVDDAGELEWAIIDAFSKFGIYGQYMVPAPVFKPSSTSGKYNIGLWSGTITSSTTRTFQAGDYDVDECFIGDAVAYHEFYNYLTEAVITGLDMELLYDGKAESVTTAELLNDVTDYDFLVLQGCYNSSGANEYDTTIIYSNIDLAESYWFGVKDRNSSYSGILTFTDATHVTLNASRRIMIYGIKSE